MRPLSFLFFAVSSLSFADSGAEMRQIQQIQQQRDGRPNTDLRRAAHARPYACLEAKVEVDASQLPEPWRKGVFRDNSSFKSWVRISAASGLTQPSDKARDLKGFALKLMEVSGPSVLDENVQTAVQDFLFTNRPVPFIYSASEQMEFFTAGSKGGLAVAWFFLTHPTRVLPLLRDTGRKIESLASESYWSRTPFSVGAGNAAKFVIFPCGMSAGEEKLLDKKQLAEKSDWYLQEDILARAREKALCFKLGLQRFENDKSTPIEDVSIEWKTPVIEVATIHIPAGQIQHLEAARNFHASLTNKQTPQDFCEHLSFNPWHSLKDHEPLGEMNRARLEVLRSSQKNRGESGGYAPLAQPELSRFRYVQSH